MIDVRRGRLDVEAAIGSVRRPDAGAIAVFLGTVRADPGVGALDYEVYRPMALRTLADLAERARGKFGVLEMSIVHRLGRVPVGGDSVVIACSAPHRREALAACAWAMDEVKRIVPIWKSEAPRRGSRRRAERGRRTERSAGPQEAPRAAPREGERGSRRSGGHRGPLPAKEAHVPR